MLDEYSQPIFETLYRYHKGGDLRAVVDAAIEMLPPSRRYSGVVSVADALHAFLRLGVIGDQDGQPWYTPTEALEALARFWEQALAEVVCRG